ncbi:stage V sporulation protein AB [Fictibacillus macauensis ZFHKF-1]|uniref:Stage V sporulation protein AB n=1 Tax=Fictibacillus macauensis ZFHKF-1 TaxID=1196324 RepID=I8J413_9BACL|nr:stage V sporulation protein AB [Fictibacillus macauensis]EIT86501.1 stage V sporulation protein AB [Fictibacillus macauensis ZFHKF-1]
MINVLLLIFVGFAGGIAVGSGFVAFLTVLGIVPRVMQLSKTYRFIRSYEWSVILGAVLGGWVNLRSTTFQLSPYLTIVIGLFSGVFIGMLAAALTEVLNVLPILAKRIGFRDKLLVILMAIVLGKVAGSLFHWIIYVKL